LVQQYGALEGVLEAGLFRIQAEMLRLYRLIATMDAKAPLPSLADQEPTWSSASDFARDWGLNQLADRLDGMALPCSWERCKTRSLNISFKGRNGVVAIGSAVKEQPPWDGNTDFQRSEPETILKIRLDLRCERSGSAAAPAMRRSCPAGP
jgi:hypothetical protein